MRRQKPSGKRGWAATIMAAMTVMVMAFWNPRGVTNKATELTDFMNKEGVVYTGLSETQTYKQDDELSCGRYRYDSGTEHEPDEHGTNTTLTGTGIGAFIDTSKATGSVIRQGKYTL